MNLALNCHCCPGPNGIRRSGLLVSPISDNLHPPFVFGDQRFQHEFPRAPKSVQHSLSNESPGRTSEGSWTITSWQKKPIRSAALNWLSSCASCITLSIITMSFCTPAQLELSLAWVALGLPVSCPDERDIVKGSAMKIGSRPIPFLLVLPLQARFIPELVLIPAACVLRHFAPTPKSFRIGKLAIQTAIFCS